MSITAPAHLQRILDNLKGVRATSDGWDALCPVHEADGQQHKPSLHVTLGTDGGTILLNCRRTPSCPVSNILSAIGLTMRDLFLPKQATGKLGEIVARYPYRDETGLLLYEAVRFSPKDFRQRTPKPGGGWEWKLNGVRRVLYHLPELLEADSSATVFIVEGEKDCDRLRGLRFVATSNVMGAGKWRDEYSEALCGRHVVVIPDGDKPGREHAQQVAKSLNGTAASVRILTLDGLPEKGDVSDWLDAGHTADELRKLAEAAPEWKPEKYGMETSSDPIKRASKNFRIVSANEVTPRLTDWLWEGRIPRGKLTLACGAPGMGKTYAVCKIISHVTSGKPWPDGSAAPPIGDALIFTAEDDPDETIVPRLIQAGADLGRIRIVQSRLTYAEGGGVRESRVDLGRDMAEIEELLDAWPQTSILVLDPIVEFAGRFESNGNIETREALAPIVSLAARRRLATLGITHFSKSVTGNALSKAIGSVAFVAVARVVWCIVPDPADPERRLLLPLKNNLSKAPSGLAFHIQDDGLHWDSEPVNVTADEALQERKGKAPDRLNEAVAFLQERLANGCCESSQLDGEAMARGISKRTLWRARDVAGVRAAKSALDGKWYVSMEAGEERAPF